MTTSPLTPLSERRFVRGMIVRGMRKRPSLAFIPLTMAFLGRTHSQRIGRGMGGEWGNDNFLKSFLCLSFPCLFRDCPKGRRLSENWGQKNFCFYVYDPIFLSTPFRDEKGASQKMKPA
jgi:hypothetical protein